MSADSKLIIRLAILSRVLIIFLQAISNYVIDDHDAGVFISPKSPPPQSTAGATCHSLIDTLFGGFRRWDAEYFLHIAEHGYTYENTLVFYPLFPFCVRYITYAIQQLVITDGCAFRDLSLAVAIVLNICFFIKAALVLHQLTIEIFSNHRLARIVTTLFCFNPASIFFSAPYTESLFCWLSFTVMLHCSRGHIWSAILPLSLGLWCRSNGILNFGFILYYVIRDFWTKNSRKFSSLLKAFLKVLASAHITCAAFAIVQVYYFSLYCEGSQFEMDKSVLNYGQQNGYILPGHNKAVWCSFAIPFSYSYLQNYYWNVGFLQYYELKQIPNFLLAAPILCTIVSHSIHFLITNPKVTLYLGIMNSKMQSQKSHQFVYAVHALALSLFCISFVHIQVSTRMLASSSPYIYWICAQHFHRENHQNSSKAFLQPKARITQFIKIWFLGYFIIGTVLFSNFLPWT